jgi:site-specific recombinase XerD
MLQMGTTVVREQARGKTLSLASMIDLFIVSKEIEGKSQKTLGWYRSMLIAYADHAGQGEDVPFDELSLEGAKSFISYLQRRTSKYQNHQFRKIEDEALSPHTIHAYVRTLKAFGAWLFEEGYTTDHPFRRLKPPKLPETMIEILSEDEITRLLNAINANTPLGARQYLIVLLLLDTGIRASELCTLTMANTNLKEGYIKVRGKGKKERMVPFGSTTKKALMRYIQTYRPDPATDQVGELILTLDGTSLTYDGLAQVCKRLAVAASIPRLHLHLFRHTFAVRYLMNGGDVMTLRLILGHTTLDVTRLYLHLSESHVQVQHHKFSPVDRLDIGRRRKR